MSTWNTKPFYKKFRKFMHERGVMKRDGHNGPVIYNEASLKSFVESYHPAEALESNPLIDRARLRLLTRGADAVRIGSLKLVPQQRLLGLVMTVQE